MEHELDDELRAHIRERADDLGRSGLSRSEAERRARQNSAATRSSKKNVGRHSNEIRTGFEIEGHPSTARSPITAGLCVAGRDYFRTTHNRLMRGREFAEGDGETGRPVAIINQAFAARYFPQEDPLGKRVKPNAETGGTPAQMSKIIGISGDTKITSLREESMPMVFVPIRQFPIGPLSVVIRSAQSPGTLLSSVRHRVQAIEPLYYCFAEKRSTNIWAPPWDSLDSMLHCLAYLALWRWCLRSSGFTVRWPTRSARGQAKSASAWRLERCQVPCFGSSWRTGCVSR
jgi:hypothetical protein